MSRFFFVLFVFMVFAGCSGKEPRTANTADKSYLTALVNPFMGTVEGNIFPGVSLPFGMVKLGPDNLPPQSTSGYRPNRPIAGFSHTHTSGTGGGPRYGNILVFPQSGGVDLADYASVRIANERAFPGFYGVSLRRRSGDVDVQLTATEKVGFHQYTFYRWGDYDTVEGSVFFDVAHTLTRAGLNDSRCLEAHIEIIGNTHVQGWGSFAGGWGGQNPYKVYFSAELDTPFSRYGVWNNMELTSDKRTLSIHYEDDIPVPERRMGAYLGYDLNQRQTIELKVAISFLSVEKAHANLAEAQDISFHHAYSMSNNEWNNKLGTIEIRGGLPEHHQIFYSALRNTFLMPTNVTGEIAGWADDRVHYWDHYCIWDVFRTVMPLHTIIAPDRQREILNSLLDIYDAKGWLPDAWVAGDYAAIQGGTNVDVVFADAVVKNLGGFDIAKAFEAVRKNAETESDRPEVYGRFLSDYLELGYVTSATTTGATSRTLEYAYNDFCIAQIAGYKGEHSLEKKYLDRSQKVFQLFNDSVGHFWAKDQEGNWQPGITPDNIRPDHWNDPYFYEATPLAYSSYVPHDMQGLIDRHGSVDAYVDYLDVLFSGERFNLGNEPLFLLPYQYIYAGRYDKTAEKVQDILRREFLSSTDGLPGQDDSGAISSWYVFSSMGFFPVAGQDIYLLGSPLFSYSRMNLENGKHFEIVAHNFSHDNIYIQSAQINGKPLNQAWFKHKELIDGGRLVLNMGDSPTDWGQKILPPSLSGK